MHKLILFRRKSNKINWILCPFSIGLRIYAEFKKIGEQSSLSRFQLRHKFCILFMVTQKKNLKSAKQYIFIRLNVFNIHLKKKEFLMRFFTFLYYFLNKNKIGIFSLYIVVDSFYVCHKRTYHIKNRSNDNSKQKP